MGGMHIEGVDTLNLLCLDCYEWLLSVADGDEAYEEEEEDIKECPV